MVGPKRTELKIRFWEKVDKKAARIFWPNVQMGDRCWLWTGAKLQHGYGMIGRGGKRGGYLLAHRASWEIHFGAIPSRLLVCHHCDNPSCVNPAHLFLASHRENSADAVQKGRLSVGEHRPQSKLNDVAVASIRRRAAQGETNREIAQDYNVSAVTIHAVVHRKTWKHIA